MPAAPILGVLAICEALATASFTTIPRVAGKNSRMLSPIEIEVERAGNTGGGTIWGVSLNGRGNPSSSVNNRADFLGDGFAVNYDTAIPFAALANYNWIVKADKSTRSGTSTTTVNSSVLNGIGTAYTTELSVGDEITINGERRIVQAITSATVLTVSQPFLLAISGGLLFLNDAVLVATTDYTVSNNGGFGRVIIAAAAKLPAGARVEVHFVVPVARFTFATATTIFKTLEVNGSELVWYVSDATAAPSSTNIYARPIGR